MKLTFKEAEILAYFLFGSAGMVISFFIYRDMTLRTYSLILLAISRLLMEIEGWTK